MLTGGGQAEPRHVDVDALVLAGTHLVGLVPDTDVARAAHDLVEPSPDRQMWQVAPTRKTVEVVEATPVLHDRRAVDDREVPLQQALLWVLVQPAQHPWHRDQHRKP